MIAFLINFKFSQMKRRNFLNQIGLLGGISLAGLSIKHAIHFPKYKMGLQLLVFVMLWKKIQLKPLKN